jgi:hypothetical protein
MRILLDTILMRRSVWLVLVVIVACDSIDGGFVGPKNQATFSQTEFYILPGTSTIIDLRSVIKQPFVSASVTISEHPVKGELIQMDAFVLKYTPTVDFTDQMDSFVFSAVLDDGTSVESETMTIYMIFDEKEFPCGVYPVEDNVRLKTTNPVVVHVKKNDQICGVIRPLNVLIHVQPKFGEAVVVGDSIIYRPGSSFWEDDELVYSLSTAGSDVVSFGLLSFNKKTIEIFNMPAGLNDIFFVDDMTGFIAGSNEILKTIDGGKHWYPCSYPGAEMEFIDFQEIHFVDKEMGFAGFSICEWPGSTPVDNECWGGWMVTFDSGGTWQRSNFYYAVSSIFFTSSQTGFISSSRRDPWDQSIHHSVFKTVDGGDNWDEVFSSASDYGELKIHFINDQVGYVYHPFGIYGTTDGGNTWTALYSKSNITSFALASDDIVCASFASGGTSVTTPSTIVRSQGDGEFTPVINFPYTILSQDFSPAGELGIAVGISASNPADPNSLTLTISKSTDKGESWVDLVDQVNGFPWEISVPSADVAYILCSDKIIKYSP